LTAGTSASDRATGSQPLPWAGRRPKVIVLGSGDHRSADDESLKSLRRQLAASCDIVREDLEFESDLSDCAADFAVVFGGDGSILRAARQMGERQIPVAGINFGRLGFLADLLPQDLPAALRLMVSGRGRITSHMMFRCQVTRGERVVAEQLGLNEVAIMSGPPFALRHIELYIDEEFATSYSCDGLIISTPVGSTAHSLSAGGPIVRKDLRAFVIAPLSPHTLTVRPIVDSANRTYEMVVRDPSQSTHALVDGQSICALTPEDRVRVSQAEPQFQMIQIEGQSYYRTLREKLGWGGAIQNTRG
jgi:NAD+ kinase